MKILSFAKLTDYLLKILNNNQIMLVVLLITGSLLAVATKFELGWDFINYHYYNAFAFMHDRLNYDIAPASLHTFFNPLIEFPWYFIIEHFNNQPNIAYALQGLWFGALLFTFFKFSCLFITIKTGSDIIAIITIMLIAITGQATFFQIGTSTNEIQIALLGFLGLYSLFWMMKEPQKQQGRLFFISGLILGAALGLKSTIIYICFSSGLSLLICCKYLRKPLIFISLFALGGLTGYFITNGWWMYKMWHLYQNPFFPFANGIFHSPYFDDTNFTDKSLIPSLASAFYFPLLWNFTNYRPTEQYFFDLHIPMFYLFGIGSLIYILSHAKIRNQFIQNRLWCFYTVFLVSSYILWLIIFSIGRYLVIIEMISAIFFVKIIQDYTQNQKKHLEFIFAFIIPLLIIPLLSTPFINSPWKGRTDNSKLIEVEQLHLPKNTLIKLYGLPLSGFVPHWAKDNDFRVLGYSQFDVQPKTGIDFAERGKFREIRDTIASEHTGPIVIIWRDLLKQSKNYEQLHQIVDKEITDMSCRELKHNFEQFPFNVYICVPPKLKNIIFQEKKDD